MFQGLRTVIYPTRDLAAATTWYTALVGHPPYFNEPFYVGFNVGGYELGLLPPGDEDAADSPTAYWGTLDIEAECDRLTGLGVVIASPVKDVGDGIKVATVKDPAGNLIGLIENPHFKIADASEGR